MTLNRRAWIILRQAREVYRSLALAVGPPRHITVFCLQQGIIATVEAIAYGAHADGKRAVVWFKRSLAEARNLLLILDWATVAGTVPPATSRQLRLEIRDMCRQLASLRKEDGEPILDQAPDASLPH